MNRPVTMLLTITAVSLSSAVLLSHRVHAHAAAHETLTAEKTLITNFPENDLAALRDQDKTTLIRLHAWNLLQQLTQYSGQGQNARPLWENWDTKCSLNISRFCSEPEPTIQQPSDGPSPQFSTVYYSPSIAEWIVANHLNDSNALYKMFAAKTEANQPLHAPTVITPTAPDTSVVVKEIWQAVNLHFDNSWSISIYDPDNFSPAATNLGDPYGQWPSVKGKPSSLKLKQNSDLSLDVTSPCNSDTTPLQAKDLGSPVPANCFVFRYTTGQCRYIAPFIPPMKRPGNDSPVQPTKPCLLVLVGVQIMTREYLENWTWNTYWWTDNPIASSGAPQTRDKSEERPSSLGSGFHNFAMDTMLSNDGDPATQGMLMSVFNPYLEGPTPGGPQSNCVQCHAKASYVPQKPAATGVIQPSPIGPRNGIQQIEKTLLSLNGDNSAVAANCSAAQLSDPIGNHCRLRTSFLWSLATNQDIASTDTFSLHIPISMNESSGMTRARPVTIQMEPR